MLTQAPIGVHLNQHPLLARAEAYFRLTKPRVVLLIVITAVVGMFVAAPGWVPVVQFLAGTAGIALAAASAAAFNQILDRQTDSLMARTRARPLPAGELNTQHALVFASLLAIVSMTILGFWVNVLTTVLTLGSLIGYSVIYTVYLKPRTPHNIVIGGAAGAAPPVLGWSAITGSVSVDALLLFLIIFLWTPPHFWSLALYRRNEYARAGVPMLPVTHGNEYTLRSMLAYSVLLAVASLAPVISGLSGALYLVGAVALNARFIWLVVQLNHSYNDTRSRECFRFSIWYLSALFGLLWIDHYRPYF